MWEEDLYEGEVIMLDVNICTQRLDISTVVRKQNNVRFSIPYTSIRQYDTELTVETSPDTPYVWIRFLRTPIGYWMVDAIIE